MKNTIIKELNAHIQECIEDGLTGFDEIFQTEYLIGYYECRQWLKEHKLDSLDALIQLQELELKRLGHIRTKRNLNHEILVNRLVWHYGLELCFEQDIENPICK